MERIKLGAIARYKPNGKIGAVIWLDDEDMEIVTDNLEQYIDPHSEFELIDIEYLLAENKRLREWIEESNNTPTKEWDSYGSPDYRTGYMDAVEEVSKIIGIKQE